MNEAIRGYIRNLALKLVGIPYIWGGSSPQIGFDCSGFCIWILQCFGILPSGDWTADGLSRTFQKADTPKAGDLAFYGKGKISHVMMVVGNDMVCGASGGGSDTTCAEIAKAKGACVKVKPLRYRSDLVMVGDISRKA